MKLSETDIRRLEAFLTRIQSDTYPEPPSELHTSITRQVFEQVRQSIDLKPGAKVLDVGCGQGVAMELFSAKGYSPVGITINSTDLEACRARGFDVREMDQSFLDFEDGSFDLVWCRHCLEHSIMPYYTLSQLIRILKPSGGLYVEVPAPDTVAAHQTNRNHYSTLPKSAWIQLITRAGILPLHMLDVPFELQSGGIDTYWCFWGRRPA